jgi:hypothetical protein
MYWSSSDSRAPIAVACNGLNIHYYFNLDVGKIFLQLVCDECKQIILEKEGEENLSYEKFPITEEEALELDKKHRGHECHIEAVEKDQ